MNKIVGVDISVCKNSPWQVRTAEENLAKPSIKISMKNNGQNTPIKGYWHNEIFWVYDGGTRLQCAKELGWKHLDAVVIEKPSVLDELTMVLTANNHSTPHWVGVDDHGEVISGKAFVISMMIQEGADFADAAHRAGVGVDDAVAADWVRLESPVEIRYALAQGRMSWSAYLQWLETEQSKQEEIVQRLGNGEKVTVNTAKRIKKEGKSLSRERAGQNQISLPISTPIETGYHTPVLVDIRKAIRRIAETKGMLVGRDYELLLEISSVISTCVEGEV